MIGGIGKFLRELGESIATGPVGSRLMPGPLEIFKAEQVKKLQAFARDRGAINMARAYFEGRNITMTAAGDLAHTAENESLRKVRRFTAGAALGIAGADALGINPLNLTEAAKSAAMLGVHGTIGYGMMGMGSGVAKLAGTAYLGSTVLNTFRGGDNIGPM
ncbi:MAG: hypothetical protein D6710_11995 [Nitrospirae bacterium]|nr:MAG: hypothetical protein D6710_11995 [Nitrospirota bacterium]